MKKADEKGQVKKADEKGADEKKGVRHTVGSPYPGGDEYFGSPGGGIRGGGRLGSVIYRERDGKQL